MMSVWGSHRCQIRRCVGEKLPSLWGVLSSLSLDRGQPLAFKIIFG